MKSGTITETSVLRRIANDPHVESEELYVAAKTRKHKFAPGETRTLIGLEDFAEFNGSKVEITAVRQDGPLGRCYYIKGDINKFLNWVYEYRLK